MQGISPCADGECEMSMLLNKCSEAELWCFYFQALVERGREERAHGIMGEVQGWGRANEWVSVCDAVCVAGASMCVCVLRGLLRTGRRVQALNRSSMFPYWKWHCECGCVVIYVIFFVHLCGVLWLQSLQNMPTVFTQAYSSTVNLFSPCLFHLHIVHGFFFFFFCPSKVSLFLFFFSSSSIPLADCHCVNTRLDAAWQRGRTRLQLGLVNNGSWCRGNDRCEAFCSVPSRAAISGYHVNAISAMNVSSIVSVAINIFLFVFCLI